MSDITVPLVGFAPPVPIDAEADICSGWIARADLPCAIGTPEQQDEAILIATGVLYAASARKYPGRCSDTVTHSREAWERVDCFPKVLQLGAEPVTGIISVEEGGTVIDSALYRVDRWRWLVRLPDADGRNPGWDLRAGVVVEFTYGTPPPVTGIRAAKDLACELLKLFTDDDTCILTNRIRSLTRQGTSIDLIVLRSEQLKDSEFGIPSVDLFILTENPERLQRPSGVLNPDLVQPTRWP